MTSLEKKMTQPVRRLATAVLKGLFVKQSEKDDDGAPADVLITADAATFARANAAGVTWDVNQHLMLRAEYSHRDGTYVLSPRENPLSELERKWHYFALQIAVRF